ncbi:glutathione S-transferase [Siccirubricoccus deserti]|uniref:Glutathione S-transferase n=1 Tax=Siccirubricoccus deserti TaxID=2013562 RepID=A0A9X0QV15_9PROT|nr:glutathione S-transferase [Siccirubricoccus deserti]MBC4013867.1 glutathione S-transferase [Siccirubricoccus deserti]GGC30126.1 glutathione S-transferase [Siccirubricoccus deserti]
MTEGRLVIGNKRYSSWSLRGWLAVQLAALDVTEVVIPLQEGPSAAVAAATPAGLMPYLEHRGARVWESLAICEYCAELAPGLWPVDPVLRAHARSIAAEMHAGFRGLRQAMPMNLGREFPGGGRTPEALADITRIEAIWREGRALTGGPFLGGAEFGLVDAMYAPVATRFLTWQPELAADTLDYVAAVRAHPLMQRWYVEALAEPEAWLLRKYESPPGALG